MINQPTFKTHYLLETLTYEEYKICLDEGVIGNIKDNISGHVRNIVDSFKSEFEKFHQNMGVNLKELRAAFAEAVKTPTFFSFVKAFGFSISKMIKVIEQTTSMLVGDLGHIFKEISDTKALQKIRDGLMSVDELIKKYPILNRTTGITVIGILLVGWINMTFVGNAKYDFNWTKMIEAFKGNYSLADVLASKDGLMFLGLVMLGVTTGIGFAWLGLAGNVVLALLYTGFYYSKNRNLNIMNKIKQKLSK